MNEDLAQKIAKANGRMAVLLDDSRRALRGEKNFGVEEIHRLQEPLKAMDQVMREAESLQKNFPELTPLLDSYKSHLSNLLTIIDQLRLMLLAKQANLLASRTQLDAATHWMAAFQATR